MKDYDLHKIISASDIVIISQTTVGLEAMILGKPVISLDYMNKFDLYTRPGAAIGAQSQEEISKAIDHILNDENARKELKANQEKFLSDYLFKLDGNSSKRVADWIAEIIGN